MLDNTAISDLPKVMESGMLSSLSSSQDSLDDLNRGWNFAIVNSSILL